MITIVKYLCHYFLHLSALLLIWTMPVLSQQVNFWTAMPKPSEQTLTRVHFIDSSRGWVAGQNGVFLYTDNGGTTWTQQLIGTTGEIPDLFARTALDIWAIEFHYPETDTSWYGTNIFHSTNGGTTWSIQKFDSALFRTIMFVDSLTGFLGGSYGTIAKTTDGGATWRQVNIGSFSNMDRWPIYKIRFQSKMFGMAVAGQLDVFGIVWRTTDGGESWTSSKISGDPLFDVVFFDSLHILCAMGDLESSGAGFLRSLDGGETWTFENTTIWGEPTTFAFRTAADCWVPMGTAGICLRSSDNGVTWKNISLPQQIPVYDISFPDSRTGYMVGHKGAMFKFNSAVLGVKDRIHHPGYFTLLQNFPNPFNGRTTFSFRLRESSQIILSIVDLLGRHIAEVHRGTLNQGEHSISWDAGNLPSGVYFYRLQSGITMTTSKLLIQR